MDRINQKILVALQRSGRISNQELADHIGLSPTPCLRRVKQLEAEGIVEGYSANINLEHYGLFVEAFVSVKLVKPDEATMLKFEKGIQLFDEVVECYLVSGKQDYLLHVVSQTLKTYEKFVRSNLTRLPEIQSIESIFAFGRIKKRSTLPVIT